MSERKLPTIYTCFPGGKHKVLTMSYDDGKLEDRRLISIFNKYGIKGTFHLNSGLEMDTRIPTSEYQELYKGHEVSCHTLTHPTIARCPMEQVKILRQSWDIQYADSPIRMALTQRKS